jgi:hypothetical protein
MLCGFLAEESGADIKACDTYNKIG